MHHTRVETLTAAPAASTATLTANPTQPHDREARRGGSDDDAGAGTGSDGGAVLGACHSLLTALAAALARVATLTILAPSDSRTLVSRSFVPACKLNLEPPAAARARSASGRGCAWSEDRVVLDLDALPRCNCAEPRRSTPPWSSLYVHCAPPQRHHPLIRIAMRTWPAWRWQDRRRRMPVRAINISRLTVA